MDIETVDKGNYVEITLSASQIPTMGANGFMARRLKLQELGLEPYMFDVDAICMLVLSGNKKLAKVKIGIVHLFAPNIATFIRKTWRRIRDFTFYERRGYRKYPWKSLAQRKAGIFTLNSLALIPVVRDSVKGYRRKPDRAWLFHPMACCLTLVIYSIYFLRNSLGRKV